MIVNSYRLFMMFQGDTCDGLGQWVRILDVATLKTVTYLLPQNCEFYLPNLCTLAWLLVLELSCMVSDRLHSLWRPFNVAPGRIRRVCRGFLMISMCMVLGSSLDRNRLQSSSSNRIRERVTLPLMAMKAIGTCD